MLMERSHFALWKGKARCRALNQLRIEDTNPAWGPLGAELKLLGPWIQSLDLKVREIYSWSNMFSHPRPDFQMGHGFLSSPFSTASNDSLVSERKGGGGRWVGLGEKGWGV